MPPDGGILTRGKDGVTGQLGSVVADHHARLMLALHATDLFPDKTASPHRSSLSGELNY